MDEQSKNIDESWKEAVEKEKPAPQKEGEFTAPEPDFSFFISTLALQASIALGQIANPADNKTENNPQQAKFIIDTLDMLKEKTKNNLTREEANLLENMLYELKMQYISKSQGGTK